MKLHAADSNVLQWLSLREMKRQCLTNRFHRASLYVTCTDQEFDEFIAFRDANRLLNPCDDCVVPYSKVLEIAISSEAPQICPSNLVISRYGQKYFSFTFQQTVAIAGWMMEKIN